MDRKRNPKVGTTVSGGVVSVRVRSEFEDPRLAQRELDDTLRRVEERLGPVVYGREDETLQHAVVALLKRQHLTLATAESCTGGLLGKFVTDVAGSSGVFVGGWVTYANDMKERQLGMPRELLERHGAVSQAVARAMARGALERSGADLAVSITGIAGPDGGTAEKPVGLVWIALAWREHGDVRTDALRFDHLGDREMVRDRAAKSALQLLRLRLLGVSLGQLTFGRRVAEAALTPSPFGRGMG
jgi:nicotinamide-nucleotide amidase